MIKSKLKIVIDKPCKVKAENFTDTQCGQFCSFCDEHVMDYTNMSSAKIISMIESNQMAKCGTFYEDQLEETYIQKIIKVPKIAWAFICSTFLFVLNPERSYSHDNHIAHVISPVEPNPGVIEKAGTISGSVYHSVKNKALKNVSVRILENDSMVIHTDKNGAFSMPIPEELQDSTFTLQVFRKDLSLIGGYGGIWQDQYMKIDPRAINVEQMLLLMENKDKPRRRLFRRRRKVRGRFAVVTWPSF